MSKAQQIEIEGSFLKNLGRHVTTTEKVITWLAGQQWMDSLTRMLMGPYVTIFMLHRTQPAEQHFHGCDPVVLENCLRYAVRQGYQFASLDELVTMAAQGVTPSAPLLCFTIDDGFRDQVSTLAPVLLRYQAKPTLFVLTDFVDGKDWPWDAKLMYMTQHSPLASAEFAFAGQQFSLNLSNAAGRIAARRQLVNFTKYLPGDQIDEFLQLVSARLDIALTTQAQPGYEAATWDELRAAQAQGLIVAAHGCNHKVFSGLSPAQVSQQLANSRARVQSEMPGCSNVFAYPSGTVRDYDRSHNALVAEAGFVGAVSAIPGNSRFSDIRHDAFNIPRHSFPDNEFQFARYCSWVEFLRSRFA